MSSLKDTAPGIGITLTIAMISFLMASLHPSFDALVISIIFGMLVSNMLGDRVIIEKGTNAALNIFLPVGIGLYGMQLTFTGTDVGFWRAVPVVAAVFVLTFAVTYYIAKGFGLGKTTSLLLGTGMSVCGASAIAVIAPIIESKKEDTSISIISVVTVGLTGMLIYRFIPDVLGLSMEKFAFLSGVTLPMFGQVKVASSTMGQESLLLASNFKLLRISALALVAGLTLVFSQREKKSFRVLWFMVLFFVLAVAVNTFKEVALLKGIFSPISKFFLSTALAAIGLSIDFDSITEKGIAPLLAAFLSWGIVVLAIYLVLSALA